MKTVPEKKCDGLPKKDKGKAGCPPDAASKPSSHLGSSNAFEETEDPKSRDPDGITDEKLDEWLDD